MKTRMSLLCLVTWAVLATPARAENYAPRIAERHGDFTLPAISDGKPVSLAQFHGKKVLLIQFASW
jgi:hypothetical protein